MTPYSPELQQLFKLLADGQWADMREVKEALADSIAPGKALRKYEERLNKRRERGGIKPMPSEPAEDEKIRFGQRLIADGVIQTAKRNYLDIQSDGGGFGSKHIRLRAGIHIPATRLENSREPSDPPEDPAGVLEGPEVPSEAVPDLPEPQEGNGYPSWPPYDRYAPSPPSQGSRPAGHGSSYDEAARVLTRDSEEMAQGMAEDDQGVNESDQMALFSERQVRSLIAQEVGAALDAFQVGFQRWLATELADMHNSACVLKQLHGLPKP